VKKAAHDFFEAAFNGWLWAVVLAWLTFVAFRIGWRSLPVTGLPLFCAYALGEDHGFRRWKRFQALLEGKEPRE
jgi:hypothetical protein